MKIVKIKGIVFKINLLLIAFFSTFCILGYAVDILVIFFSLIVHELLHIVVAIKKGIKIKEIEFFPFGGLAKFEDFIGHNPTQEMLICIAGPLINLIIAGIFFITNIFIKHTYIVGYIIKVNLCIGLFNLLPVLPLDGGRIFRAILACKFGLKNATNKLLIATYIFASSMIFLGVYNFILFRNGVYLILIAIFIIMAAKKEKKMAAFLFMREIACKNRNLLEKGVMNTHLLVALKTVSIKDVMDNFLPQKYHIIIVIDKYGNKLGTINEEKLLDEAVKNGIYTKLENLLFTTDKW